MFCILIAGMPAGGKSTLAKRLSELLGLPMYSKDSIKEILFDDLGFNSREEKNQLGVAAMHMLYYAAEQTMRTGKSFILENNFENSSVAGIMELLEKYHYTGITVRLVGDPEVLYQRFAARDLSPERHRGHVVNDHYPEPAGAATYNPTRKSYDQYMKDIETRGFTKFQANGPCIEVDVTDHAKVDYMEIIEWIRKAMRA